MNARYINDHTRIVPKHDDGTGYCLTAWDGDPDANVWSLETKADDGLWHVKADFFDRDMAMRYARPCFMDMEEARGGAFVAIGAQEHKGIRDAIYSLDEGEIGLVERLVACGKLTEEVWQKHLEDGVDIDFVWDYEVCSKLGIRIVEHLRLGGTWPDDGIITIWIRQLSAVAAPNS